MAVDSPLEGPGHTNHDVEQAYVCVSNWWCLHAGVQWCIGVANCYSVSMQVSVMGARDSLTNDIAFKRIMHSK